MFCSSWVLAIEGTIEPTSCPVDQSHRESPLPQPGSRIASEGLHLSLCTRENWRAQSVNRGRIAGGILSHTVQRDQHLPLSALLYWFNAWHQTGFCEAMHHQN